MIQDIFPHVYHNEYHDVRPRPESIALYYEGDTLLIKRDAGVPVFPRFADFENNKIYENATYLFTIDEDEFFLVDEVPGFPHGFSMEKIASLLNKDDHYPQFAAVTGRQLRDWYRDRKYCGRCGKPLKKDTKERMLYCDCGQIEYPKISLAVIVAVLNGDKIGRAHV